MTHKYIVKIDRLCTKCGFKNRTEIVDTKPIEIAACGKCGDLFLWPDNMSASDMEQVKALVRRGIKEREEDALL